MRLWTVHPRYLDRQGLTALWREGILAQTVLCGETKGYTHHPQLQRFRDLRSPVADIATYLEAVYAESIARGYHFNHSLIRTPRMRKRIPETHGQLLFEWNHLLSKLQKRSPAAFTDLQGIRTPESHPLFAIVPGEAKEWERGKQNKTIDTYR